jgi:hypothetical protein
MKTNVQIYIQTNRNKDVETYTDKQTDSAKVLVQAEKQTDVQKDNYSHIQYIPTVLYIIQTYTQTDRQDRQKKMTNRPTNRQTDSI